jgi:hypothetical protein
MALNDLFDGQFDQSTVLHHTARAEQSRLSHQKQNGCFHDTFVIDGHSVARYALKEIRWRAGNAL